MVKRVVRNAALYTDFDMGERFPPYTFMENLEDASSGSYEELPRKTLRERSYGKSPLMIKPTYSGDFLEKLKSPIQGKPLEVESSDPTNLLDFSSPEEMLKHQEEPNPRVILDQFIEGPGRLTDDDNWDSRDKDLKDFDDRAWDVYEAPEMSEDSLSRTWGNPMGSPLRVMANHIANSTGNFSIRFGKLIEELDKSPLPGTTRKNIKESGARIIDRESSPKTGKWVFSTGSTTGKYKTTFQFKLKGTETDLKKLEVLVSCTCNSWFFWGPQFNAWLEKYLYPPVVVHAPYGPAGYPVTIDRPKNEIRRNFLICKHIKACIPILLQQKLDFSDVSEEMAQKLEKEIKEKPQIKVEIPKKIKTIIIPWALKKWENQLPIRGILKEWKRMTPDKRKEFVDSLQHPGQVHYLGYKFPDTSIEYVVPRLEELSKSKNSGIKQLARQYLRTYMSRRVVCAHLMERFPIDTYLDTRNTKVAKLLSELEDSMIYSSEEGYKKLDYQGVKISLSRAEPRKGRWTFNTSSGNEIHTTIFQFLPQGNIRDTYKLHVRVSCSCPSWLYWGAQYNAMMNDYLYGDIRPKFTPPEVRDPDNRFKICKHIMACIPVVSKYRLMGLDDESRERLKKPLEIKLDKDAPQELIHIPERFRNIGKQKKIRDIIKVWDSMSPQSRKKFIMGLDDDQAYYMSNRFPETATIPVINKIKS